MENLLSIKKKSFFPGLTLLLAGFLAGMLIPNFIYRFSWKQQAFSAVYLLETYGKTEAGGIDYLLQILWMRGGIFFLSLICGFTVFGVPMAIMAMFFTGIGLGIVFSMSILFPHYLIYLQLWDSVYQMVYRESMGIWRNHGIFPQKVSAYLLKVLLYTALYGAGILLEWRVNPWILNKILDFSKFFE